MTFSTRRASLFILLGGLAVAAGCSRSWETTYTPLDGAADSYRLAGVSVIVPQSLTVSESETSYVPQADIVWVEEPAGDRRAQVARIFEEGVRAGAAGLRGSTPVTVEVTVQKFHALNMKSRYNAPQGTGVYDITFTARILDAKSGAELVPTQQILANAPARTGDAALAEEAAGITQRSTNVAQIAATIAGWLRVGPDNRTTFRRLGG